MVTKKKVATSKAVKGSKPKRVVKKASPKKRGERFGFIS